MSDDASRKRLGKGLAALIGELDSPQRPQAATGAGVETAAIGAASEIAIGLVSPNPANPRRAFNDAELADLAESVRAHGVVQPVIVRPAPGRPGAYELIAGERRWRAAQRAGLERIPVLIKPVDDKTALELAIVENVQRADLNAVEEAAGYQQLIDIYEYSQNDLAQVIGKSRSHVANTLRLLRLPETVRAHIISGALSAGHARALITANDPEGLAERVLREGLSVRDIERLAQSPAQQPTAPKIKAEKDADLKALERDLGAATGMKVAIDHGQRGGSVTIQYKTLEQLDEIIRRLKA
ncbi:MAG: ParB/RepB/Spo0J family partition protein [Rhizobiaceae bacterium]|jgi:ParB family chromosome partitioning protein|nr:ParB/RepB/Spo0J family partition protein [Rhizobiaceae bacterium]